MKPKPNEELELKERFLAYNRPDRDNTIRSGRLRRGRSRRREASKSVSHG